MAALLRVFWAAPVFLVVDATLFLEQELPLKVLSAQPTDSEEGSYRLQQSEALTIIFSRPVIALGSDWKDSTSNGVRSAPFHFESCKGWPTFQVPGKTRWTTTSIVRFDPDINWPTDLCFDLVVNESLSTYDGVNFLSGQTSRWRFSSEPLQMSIRQITSKESAKVTGGRWSSHLPDGREEAPPDAAIYITFFPNFGTKRAFLEGEAVATGNEEEATSIDSIDHGSIFKQLVRANRDLFGADGESTFSKCGSSCLKLQPKHISQGKDFRMVYPKNSQPNSVSGPTREDIFVEFVGLQPFIFDSVSHITQYRRQRLYLRHGVEGGNATQAWLNEMASSIHFKNNETNDDVKFDLRQLDEVTLLLELPGLMPERAMDFEVHANSRVRDGFGQALQASRQGISTQAVRNSFDLPRTQSVLYLQNLTRWEAFASGECKKQSNWNSILKRESNRDWSRWCPAPTLVGFETIQDILDFTTDRLSSSGLSLSADTLSLPSEKLLSKVSGSGRLQGLFAAFDPDSRYFVSVSSFGASVVPIRTGLLVWATRFEDGAPLQNVDIVFTIVSQNYIRRSRTGKEDLVIVKSVLARGKTDAEGLAQLPFPWDSSRSSRNFAVLMEHPDHGLTIVEHVRHFYSGGRTSPRPGNSPNEGIVLTDRKVYQPGDTIYFKGYLRTKEDGKMVVPVLNELDMWGQDKKVNVNSQFGTWSCELELPKNASNGNIVRYTWSDVGADHDRYKAVLVTTQVLVADPRPPTVSLTLDTPSKVILPGVAAKLPLRLRTATYTGASVNAANVTIEWIVRRFMPLPPTGPREGIFAGTSSLPRASNSGQDNSAQLSGTTALVADENGEISEDLDVEALLKEESRNQGKTHVPCREGDSVEVKATWVGPTREVVTKTLPGIPVSRSKWEIAVRPSSGGPGKPLPGRKYGISAIVRPVAEGGREDVGGDFQLVASLHEWNGTALPDNLLPTSVWGHQVGQDCQLVSRSLESLPECVGTLTMPEAKKYIVLIRGQDPEGVEIQTAWTIGRSMEDWKVEVVRDLDLQLTVRTDKTAYRHGETMKLTFESSLGGDATLLVLWGPAETSTKPEGALKTLVVRQSAASGEIDVPIDESCIEACTVRVVLASGRQREEHLLPVKLPTSPLLDVTAPQGLSETLTVDILKDEPPPLASEDVKITIKATDAAGPATVFEPGTEAEIEVALPIAEAGSEVAIFITDKAMLDVGGSSWAHPLANVSSQLQSKLATGTTSFEWYDLRTDLASSEGLDKTLEILKRRESIDPWLVAEGWTTTTSNGWLRDVEMSDEAYLSKRRGELNNPPGGGMNFEYSARSFDGAMGDDMAVPEAMPMSASSRSAPAPAAKMMKARMGNSAQGGGGGGGAASSDHDVQMSARTNFVTTPVFAPSLIVGADGVARHKFKFPDNVGTFQVRVYIVDGKKESRFVSKEEEVSVRRQLTLQPSIPRVTRPGDKFEAGVLLTVHANDGTIRQDSLTVGASVAEQTGSIRLIQDREGSDGQSVFRPVDAGHLPGPQEILFPFQVPTFDKGGHIGTTNLSFVAYQEQSILDSLAVPLKVKPDQAPVLVATSLTIPATAAGHSPSNEGLELPEAVPGSGSIELTASVGHLDSAVAATEPLLDIKDLTSYDMLGWLLGAAALRLYLDSSFEPTPDSLGFKLFKVVELADGAGSYLKSATDDLGLRLEQRKLRRVAEKDYALNMQGCRVVSLLERLFPGATTVSDEVSDAWRLVAEESLTRQWKDLVRSGCSTEENRTKSFCIWTWESWWEALARSAVCFGREGLSRIAPESANELFTNDGIVHNLTVESQAHLLLGLQMESTDGSIGSTEKVVLRKIPNWIRIRGRSAYIAQAHGGSHSAGIHVNALLLLSLAIMDPTKLESGLVLDRLVEGLAQSLRPKRSSIFWAAGSVQATAVAALSKYDESRHLTHPDLQFAAASGSQPLLQQKIDSQHLGGSKEMSWESLPSPPPPLKFSAQGTGEVMVVAALRFIPAAPATAGLIYRGLLVEKVVRRACPISGLPVGPPLQAAALGTVVVVTIQITTPDDLNSVIVEDFPSGGLEPLDPALDPAGREPMPSPFFHPRMSGGRMKMMRPVDTGFRFDWFKPFDLVSIQPEVAKWKSRGNLRAGSYTVTYRAVATTRGAFSLPSAHAYSADEEEIMGLSRAGSFVIAEEGKKLPDPHDESAVAAFLSEAGRQVQVAPAAPKPCPGGCPNGGVCRPDVGQCGCFVAGILKDGDCDPSANDPGLRGLPKDSTLIGRDGLAGQLTHGDVEYGTVSPWVEVTVVGVLALLLVSGITIFAKHYAASWPNDIDNFEGTPYTASLEQVGSEIEMTHLVRGRSPSPNLSAEDAQGRGTWL